MHCIDVRHRGLWDEQNALWLGRRGVERGDGESDHVPAPRHSLLVVDANLEPG